MGGSKENNTCHIQGSSNFQDDVRVGSGKQMKELAQNQRRALGVINQNIMGANIQPSDANKKKFSGIDDTLEPNQELAEAVITNYEETKDYSIIDVGEEYEDDNHVPVPMFIRHTEAFLDEIDRMDVDEMEDVEEEDPIVDIDTSDLKNPLAVVEYVDDIYTYYRKIEISSCVSPIYMDYQSDINEKMRAILIDWLLEVHYKFELMDETLFLTVNLIDRFLEKQLVVRKKLQLVGVTAMLLACKYEEVSVPIVDDFIMVSDNAYTSKEVLEMEKLMVNTLQFNMSVPTPYVFMRRFLKAAQSNKKLELLAYFIIELCMVEYKMLEFPPSLLAASAIYTAQCCLYQVKQWSKASEWHTDYSEDQLLECSRLMVKLHEKAAKGKLTGVYKKYCTSKFGHAAKAEPAMFLLDH